MSGAARVLEWEDLRPGMAAETSFRVAEEDMEAFAKLSGDTSRIHVSREFARTNGFKDPVVYGAFIVAKLSEFVGMWLPGDLGLATSWRIDFHNPLYVGDMAVMAGEISHKSEATRTVVVKFKVRVGDLLIAAGSAGSKVLVG